MASLHKKRALRCKSQQRALFFSMMRSPPWENYPQIAIEIARLPSWGTPRNQNCGRALPDLDREVLPHTDAPIGQHLHDLRVQHVLDGVDVLL